MRNDLFIDDFLLGRLCIRMFRGSGVITFALLMLGLASCGGGSDTPGNTVPLTTITYLDPVGLVATASSQPLSIFGTNFEDGMTVSVTDKNGVSYAVDTVTVLSSTTITANLNTTIAAPVDNYLNITVIPSNSTPVATAVLGVAGNDIKLDPDVQTILSAKCGTCHTGSAPHLLDMSSLSASSSANSTGLIGIPSYNCSPRFRVAPGDPRRTRSVLIDKILVFPSGQSACSGGQMPPSSSPQLSPTEIQTIIDWVAGGAK